MIKRELSIFLIVGTLTVLVDYISYRSLLWLSLTNVEFAKGLGFIAGTLFAYIANKQWTFGHQTHEQGSFWRFMGTYSLTLAMNIYINSMILTALADQNRVVLIAFLIATAVSAALNFIGMKYFVFRTIKV